MLEHYLRPAYQTLFVKPLIKLLPPYILHKPHLITFGALLCGLMILVCLSYQHSYLAILFLALSGYLDTLDGSVARLSHSSSDIGAVFDIVSDRLVEVFIILGLFLVAPQQRALSCLLMLASLLICVTSFLVVAIFVEQQSEKSFYHSPGMMERAEAFLFFAAMMIYPAGFQTLAIIFSGLVSMTAIARVWQFNTVQKITY